MENQNQINPSIQKPLTPQQSPNIAEAVHTLDKTEKYRHLFYQVLIACLLASAAVAVIAVLAGGFSHTLGRALATIALVALHAALSFGYITGNDNQNKKDGGRSIELFSNTVFTLVVASFITSQFAIWQVLDGNIVLRLYGLYGVLLFATLHSDVLYRIRGFERRIDNIVSANYFTMAFVVVMLAIVIFSRSLSDLGSFYYRLLAAIAIIDATMTITVIIMHKMFLQKHPGLAAKAAQMETAKTKNFWHNPLVILLLIFLAIQVIGSFIVLLAHGL